MERPRDMGLAAGQHQEGPIRQQLHRQRNQRVRNKQLHHPHHSGEKGDRAGTRRIYRGRKRRHAPDMPT